MRPGHHHRLPTAQPVRQRRGGLEHDGHPGRPLRDLRVFPGHLGKRRRLRVSSRRGSLHLLRLPPLRGPGFRIVGPRPPDQFDRGPDGIVTRSVTDRPCRRRPQRPVARRRGIRQGLEWRRRGPTRGTRCRCRSRVPFTRPLAPAVPENLDTVSVGESGKGRRLSRRVQAGADTSVSRPAGHRCPRVRCPG